MVPVFWNTVYVYNIVESHTRGQKNHLAGHQYSMIPGVQFTVIEIVFATRCIDIYLLFYGNF